MHTGARSRAHLIVWAYEKGYFIPEVISRWTDVAEPCPHRSEPQVSREAVSLTEWREQLRTARADLDALLTRLAQQ